MMPCEVDDVDLSFFFFFPFSLCVYVAVRPVNLTLHQSFVIQVPAC